MAILCLKVPQGIAKTLSGIDVPGEQVPTDEKHITILNLGDNLPVDLIGKTVIAVARATETIKPFHVEVAGYSCFPKGDSGMVPVICPVKSDELHAVHSVLAKALDSADIEYSKKFPEYKPHVTLSFADETVNEKTFKTSLGWTATELVLWCGDHGDERIYTVFDFLG